MKMLFFILTVVALIAIGFWVLSQRGPDLAADYQSQLKTERASDATRAKPIVTLESIAHLPKPVQRYMQVTGSIGKPRVASVLTMFDAEMFQKSGGAAMPGPAEQYDRFDPPKRLFFMDSRMYGLPVKVLHDYEGIKASMRVRLASLFNVVDIKERDDLARTETVTLLNDLCFFAPSWLADERLEWRAIDDTSADVTFTNGPHKISAKLLFNAEGELINFISEDRGALQDDGTLRILRWSTPMTSYKTFNGRRFAATGEAIWHYPEGDFVYGKLTLRDVKVTE
jgi:hypothetical protein